MSLIDCLRRLAYKAQPLRYPAAAAGAVSFVAAAAGALVADQERYLIPGIVGLLWSLSTYAVIATFRFVPAQLEPGERLLARLKRRIRRGGYWLLALLCAGSTLAVVWVSFRLGSIWWREFNY